MMVEARDLRYRYSGADVDAVKAVSLSVSGGELLGVVGPNGSGKTTLLRLLLGLAQPAEGSAMIVGRPAHEWSRRALARVVAVVAQREEPIFPLRVRQAVMFGRYPHMGPLGAPRTGDYDVVRQALKRCDIAELADRWLDTLSGGEWQRVRIARALAQEARILVLDEATANLDVRHEMQTLELVSGLVRESGIAGIVVTHHVNLAARFVDQMLVLERGVPRAKGTPPEVLTREVFEAVFDWPVAITRWDGVPQVVPLRRETGNGGTRS